MTRKLLLLINSLEGGGAERVFVNLANHLADHPEHWTLRIATLDNAEDAYALRPETDRTSLGCDGSFRRSVTEVTREIGAWQPDVVLSFLTRGNCAAILARRAAEFPLRDQRKGAHLQPSGRWAGRLGA